MLSSCCDALTVLCDARAVLCDARAVLCDALSVPCDAMKSKGRTLSDHGVVMTCSSSQHQTYKPPHTGEGGGRLGACLW
jgi:hypothetical protein